MSGLGSALQNIGQQWSQRISDKESEERLARKQAILDRTRQQNAMELARFKVLLEGEEFDRQRRVKKEDEEALRNSPEYQSQLKYAQQLRDAELKRIQSQTESNLSRAKLNEFRISNPNAGRRSSSRKEQEEDLRTKLKNAFGIK